MNIQDVLLPGAVVDGRYRIESIIGQGGVARVYKATQLDLKAPVALKVVSYVSSNITLVHNLERRLIKEGRAAAKIRHPNAICMRAIRKRMMVDVNGKRAKLDKPYIVMDCLQGHTLRHELEQNGPLEPQRALRHVRCALDALWVAHEQGIVHKDLKPSNLFLTAPGTHREALVVLDFGVARQGDPMTVSVSPPVTPHYAAPEYISSQKVGPAVDVYQMGLILIEMLTGKSPVDDESPIECLRRHVDGELEVAPWLMESPLGPLLKSATATNPAERIAHAGIFYKVLGRISPQDLHPVHT